MGPVVTTDEFADLYSATVRDVLAYVRRRTTRDVDDLVAETYVVAWRRRSDLPAIDLRRAWLFGVARNLLHADRRRQRREGDLVEELADDPARAAQPSPAAGPGGQVVRAALGRLTPKEREVLLLTSWDCLTPAEVAVVLGVRPSTARVRLHRARQALASDPDVRALVERDPSVLATSPSSRTT